MSKLSLHFGIVLFACQLASSSRAENTVAPPYSPKPPYPSEAQITFQWNYSCPEGACSFRCPGTGGARSVRTLDLYLGTLPTGNHERIPTVFYNFSTAFVPRGNGFATGLLSCQVNGMTLDYVGRLPRRRQGPAPETQ